MTAALTRYDAARRALAEARAVDEVKQILDKSVALKAYARQSKDEQLMADATVIQHRATRRLGEIMAEKREEGELPEGRPKKRGLESPVLPTLEAQGVDKHLAQRARAAAAMPEAQFEAALAKVKRLAIATVVGDTSVIKEARAERQSDKRARRQAREIALGQRQAALPDRKYGVIYADPEWQFEPYSLETGMDRSADNHYPTSDLATIKAREVEAIAADDCVLFLWATVPMLEQALDVMDAWGFEYKSHFVWKKDRIGTGYWSRNKHEILLIGTRGNIPAPAMGDQWDSVIDAPVGEHSAKPEVFLSLVERYFPSLPKVELNCRGVPRPTWDGWGLESEQPEAAE